MIVGIPQALIYWKQPYFWENFFENLGFKVLLSPKTNREIVEQGVKVSDPENCFSNKVYWGHLLWLDGKCDYIFVPRLKAIAETSSHLSERSEGREMNGVQRTSPRVASRRSALEYCPKFFGLPDLAKILVKTPILTETFDPRKERTEKTFKRLGKKLKKDGWQVKKALEAALLKEKELNEKETREFFERIESGKQKIILVSHPYNLCDEYVNLRMKEVLGKLGAEPIFIDEVPVSQSPAKDYRLPVEFHWEFGKEIMEKIQEVLKYKISGAIEISSFACGCDAVIKEFVAEEFKKNKIPFLYLIIDEHTGEAGFQTRLEAFMDTLK